MPNAFCIASVLALAVAVAPVSFAQAPLDAPTRTLASQRDALSRAITAGDAATVTRMVRGGMKLDFNLDDLDRGRSFESPLTLALHRDRVDIVQILIEAGADVQRQDGSGTPPVHAARSAAALGLLVKAGADPDALDRNRRSPLVDAIERGDPKRIDFLVAAGARLEPPPGTADLFTRAVASGHPELVEALLQRGADPRTPPTQALWPLIESGNTPVARLLLARGADPDARKDRDSLLSRALFRRRFEIVEALLEAGARANLRDDAGCAKTYNDCLPIIVARGAANDPALLKRLVSRGLDLNTAAADGHTALTATILERPMSIRAVAVPGVAVGVAQNAATGQARIVTAPSKPAAAEIPAVDVAPRIRALIAAGADPNRRIGALTPLMLAVDMPELPQSTALAVAQGGGRIEFESTIPAPRDNDPPALLASRAGGALSVEQWAMLSNVQGIHTGMNVGPLGWAVLHGRPDVARFLLERDRRIAPADRNLLYFAAITGAWDVVVAAAPLSPEVNAANRAGVTPLMLAANAGRGDAVRALLAAKADVNARSAGSWPPFFERSFASAFAGHSPSPPPLVGGYTALRAANEQKHAEVARLLTEAGARP